MSFTQDSVINLCSSYYRSNRHVKDEVIWCTLFEKDIGLIDDIGEWFRFKFEAQKEASEHKRFKINRYRLNLWNGFLVIREKKIVDEIISREKEYPKNLFLYLWSIHKKEIWRMLLQIDSS